MPMQQEAKALSDLQTFLEAKVLDDTFSGCVLIACDGIPIFQGTYGQAEKNFSVPNQLTTKFNIGSVTKTLTAVAVMDLVQQGKLHLDDPLSTYLPDCPHAEAITIHHLLTHTAGLGDGLQALKSRQATEKTESEWLMDLLTLPSSLQDLPFASGPGERYQYSNAGYSLLGLVMEEVTQQGYYSWMREHVYRAIGMHDTDAYPLDMVVPNRAYGYTFGFPFQKRLTASRPGKQNCTSLLPYKGEPSGGVYSTAPDLLLLAEALRKHTFLRSEYAQMMMTGKADMGTGASYGYGLTERILPNERIVGHNGGLAGWSASFELYMHRSYTVIILANYDPYCADQVAGKIRELLVAAT